MGVRPYRVLPHFRLNILESHRKVDQVQVNVVQTPGFKLQLRHLENILALVVVVPQLGGDEKVFTLDQAIGDSLADALASFLFVLVVVRTIKQSISDLDGLW